MEKLNVFIPGEISPRLENMGESGINIEHFKMLEKIRMSGEHFMENSVGSIFVNSSNELFSRDIARKTILYANMAGCMFPGRPLSEATGSLKNLKFPGRPLSEATGSLKNLNTRKKMTDLTLEEVCLQECKSVVDKLMEFNPNKLERPKILALHASNYNTSNTLSLWKMVKSNLEDFDINEIHIENGSVRDCKGCSYKACKHYSQSSNCFYGGIMVEEIYPAIINCDVLVMVCPNYNDSISANMSAAINRLTALFRKFKFYDKYVYAVIVSGF
ncbi:MAG: NAD(P)H-dependent oxidoreductase, partial [Sedimentibacter sp.]|nr:NAD(P)H-dependent oxidoreductase [Sedimentibacter sp.]